MFLSVIIPAYNEEKRLPETLKKVRNYLNHQNITRLDSARQAYEVIVVNDGSTDSTPRVASGLIKDWDGFRLVDNKENQGKGAVVKQGMLEAKGDWRLFMDADNSTDISEIEKLWKFANQSCHSEQSAFSRPESVANATSWTSQEIPRQARDDDIFRSYDFIIGSRYLSKDSIKIKQPLSRRVVSRFGNLLVRLFLGIKSVDTQCGFKLFSKEATEKIFPLQEITRWGFDMEILAIAIKKGYKIKEVPVSWCDAEGSQVKKSATFKTLKELLTIKWNMMKGKYN
ncbi:MAG: Glycosyl transferase, family 2 [Berkelbacteria bacterium GW2011_GWA1_36_9]|uniref:dolichyl-phosphate beta-glucosyltransferase n=1 Tax=Berkelbacteria bacterium GW2011_GWA1_36_9 TaxID=1618331 RepID=A0A0G0FY45_9BACT|nr:MAG: Glycosyl transferase, family 2 [Berkelbacteria bacterium GW2011_GWA1_36_9]